MSTVMVGWSPELNLCTVPGSLSRSLLLSVVLCDASRLTAKAILLKAIIWLQALFLNSRTRHRIIVLNDKSTERKLHGGVRLIDSKRDGAFLSHQANIFDARAQRY